MRDATLNRLVHGRWYGEVSGGVATGVAITGVFTSMKGSMDWTGRSHPYQPASLWPCARQAAVAPWG